MTHTIPIRLQKKRMNVVEKGEATWKPRNLQANMEAKIPSSQGSNFH